MTDQFSQQIMDTIESFREMQGEAMEMFMGQVVPGAPVAVPEAADVQHWSMIGARLNQMWMEFQAEKLSGGLGQTSAKFEKIYDPEQWAEQWSAMLTSWNKMLPVVDSAQQQKLFEDGMALWNNVLSGFGLGNAGDAPAELPRQDRRFKDPKWRENPVFTLIHQTYLMLAEQTLAAAENMPGIDPEKRAQLKFSTQTIVDALSPSNFPMTNPLVLERTLATKGENLVKGLEHMLADIKKGQLSHTDSGAFELGKNIAITPGKVVYETDLYQLIQYSPTTENVMTTPLVVFPPWINRYYILDLNPKKSFVRWAVEQGITVFMTSWKSADASMKDVIWDDYVLGQIEAIDFIRERLKVPSVNAIGYCVAGTTLSGGLALLARRGEADKVKSATFFTAQVDFERSGELKLLVDDKQIAMMERLVTDGYLDGRYMAATFNLLRGPDLIWNYVINNYMMGDDYPAFDLLHWNGDTTNLPFKWQKSYLEDLYRDNRLVQPDSMVVDGTPLDLRRIETPCYLQAGREDHIAPPDSVWRMTRHVSGPTRFVLAGSGHIAGVVNPPDAGKYQYWLNPAKVSSLDEFIEGAVEHKGSWWPDWIEWLRDQDSTTVAAKGKRKPGSKGDTVIEDAPGSYVRTR